MPGAISLTYGYRWAAPRADCNLRVTVAAFAPIPCLMPVPRGASLPGASKVFELVAETRNAQERPETAV